MGNSSSQMNRPANGIKPEPLSPKLGGDNAVFRHDVDATTRFPSPSRSINEFEDAITGQDERERSPSLPAHTSDIGFADNNGVVDWDEAEQKAHLARKRQRAERRERKRLRLERREKRRNGATQSRQQQGTHVDENTAEAIDWSPPAQLLGESTQGEDAGHQAESSSQFLDNTQFDDLDTTIYRDPTAPPDEESAELLRRYTHDGEDFNDDGPGAQLRSEAADHAFDPSSQLLQDIAQQAQAFEQPTKTQRRTKSANVNNKKKADTVAADGSLSIPKISSAVTAKSREKKAKQSTKKRFSKTKQTEPGDLFAVPGTTAEDGTSAELVTPASTRVQQSTKRQREPKAAEDTPSSARPASKRRKMDPTSSATTTSAPNNEMTTRNIISGPFSPDELNTIANVVSLIRETYGLDSTELANIVQDFSRESDERRSDLWDHLANALPQRPRVAIQKTVRRRYHNFSVRAKWTEADDEDLKQAYARTPQKWRLIGQAMNRMSEDCRDRWRNYHSVASESNIKRNEPWTQKEEMELSIAVQECAVLVEAEMQRVAEEKGEPFDEGKDWTEMVNFLVVSEKLGQRTRIQCYQHWRTMKKRDEKIRCKEAGKRSKNTNALKSRSTGSDWRRVAALRKYAELRPKEKVEILNMIVESGTFEEDRVPWSRIAAVRGKTGLDLNVAFEKMKMLIPKERQGTLQGTVEALLEYYEENHGDALREETPQDAQETSESRPVKPKKTRRKRVEGWSVTADGPVIDETSTATPAKSPRVRKPPTPATESPMKPPLSAAIITETDDEEMDAEDMPLPAQATHEVYEEDSDIRTTQTQDAQDANPFAALREEDAAENHSAVVNAEDVSHVEALAGKPAASEPARTKSKAKKSKKASKKKSVAAATTTAAVAEPEVPDETAETEEHLATIPQTQEEFTQPSQPIHPPIRNGFTPANILVKPSTNSAPAFTIPPRATTTPLGDEDEARVVIPESPQPNDAKATKKKKETTTKEAGLKVNGPHGRGGFEEAMVRATERSDGSMVIDRV